MCEYIVGNQCKITNTSCPYMYFCNKTLTWKESNSMPNNCKIKQKGKIPDGTYQVVFERKGKLYVDINNTICILENPYQEIPEYVKVYKNRQGILRIKK